MLVRVASWNINSVRLRAGLVQRYLKEASPDILCLQETKVEDYLFPKAPFEELGYRHIVISGQKSYNGVAILSKIPLQQVNVMDILQDGSTRHISAVVGDHLTLHNFYIPAGGDVPDTALNPKFADKLRFVDTVRDWSRDVKALPVVAVGDFNIAPFEQDVWSHRQLLKVVSHTPVEVEKLTLFREAGGWIDTARQFVPHEEKLYSWWSYRNRDWKKSDRGRRLDHIWVTEKLRPALRGYATLKEARDWKKPSDHVPIMTTLEL